ncbi:JAB domain-containing protein [Sphingomonas sp. LT1P40]|uniref:JAB domain-containing protein n=1 Tax=Alteristakelama amylovorans TaxID=3096166 RepID=UPI002FC81929
MASHALVFPLETSFDTVGDLVADSVTGQRAEVAAFAWCDRAGRVLGLRHARSGLADAVDVPVRRIAIDALAFDAVAVVMAHNHPSGDAWPSRADRATTRRIAEAMQALGVRLHDHVIVGSNGARWSFRAAGLL